jgi:hypothetical protein
MTSRAAQFHPLYREPRIANQRDCYRERRREYGQANGQAIVVRNMLLVLVALAGVAGQLVTGTDRALSGVIAVRPRSSTLERVRAVLGRVKSPEGFAAYSRAPSSHGRRPRVGEQVHDLFLITFEHRQLQ